MNYKSYQDISLACWNNLHRLPVAYDLIVGIPRSGMIPATMLSLYLNTNLSSLDAFLNGEIMDCGSTRVDRNRIFALAEVKNVLVVDDSIDRGVSIREAKNKISSSAILRKYNLRIDYAAVYSSTGKDKDIMLSFETLPQPRCFQWNIFNHPRRTCTTCYDIDGIVCRDPTGLENDDGDNYKKFIRSAEKRLPIDFQVGAFVSSRLEKYRMETTVWLHKNGYRFRELVLLDLPSKESRIKQNAHASFKASVYKQRTETLFVESEWKQAVEIARLSGKDVFCTENMRYIKGGGAI